MSATSRIAIISDIHGNLEALEAVLADLERKRATKIYCLGDIIGYGPNPREVLDIVQAVAAETVLGNHEDLVMGHAPEGISPSAMQAAQWTRKRLMTASGTVERKKERWEWLKALPLTEEVSAEVLLAHGMPVDCYEYVLGPKDAAKVLQRQMGGAKLCFIGHTHVPAIWTYDGRTGGYVEPERKKRYCFPKHKLLVNVGSVGQPRDHDPRASYVLLHDDGSVEFRRVEYDAEKTAKKIFDIPELPNWLGERLLCGE